MRSLSSGFLLLDLRSSWQSANQIPISTFAYLHTSNLISSLSSSFRLTPRARRGIVSSSSYSPSLSALRRPADRFSGGNGSPSSAPSTWPSSSRSDAVSELELFLELVPPRIRGGLFQHEEIQELIEVVMDLGRKPLARFPSGDWVMSELTVKLEDLRHAISKVIRL
ncbi:hypothetical protein ACLOJK_020954 [Asimina triloba]